MSQNVPIKLGQTEVYALNHSSWGGIRFYQTLKKAKQYSMYNVDGDIYKLKIEWEKVDD